MRNANGGDFNATPAQRALMHDAIQRMLAANYVFDEDTILNIVDGEMDEHDMPVNAPYAPGMDELIDVLNEIFNDGDGE